MFRKIVEWLFHEDDFTRQVREKLYRESKDPEMAKLKRRVVGRGLLTCDHKQMAKLVYGKRKKEEG